MTAVTASRFRWHLLVIAAALAGLYLVTLTSDYYWDGITFALQIEKVAKGERGASLLFHQNHLLYNGFGYLTYKGAQALGLDIRALTLLQVANAFAAAAAAAVFFNLAERVTLSRYAAAVSSVFLAVSAAWWKMATDANAYILALLLILVCARNLLGSKPRWFVAGLALAGAMLMHELSSLFYPAALAAVLSSKAIDRRAKFAARLSILSWGIAISAYYLCAVLLRDITKPLDVIKWAVSNPSGESLSSSRRGGVLMFAKLSVDSIAGHSFALFRRESGWVEFTLVVLAIVAAILFAATAVRRVPFGRAFRSLKQSPTELSETRRQLIPVLILWIGTYALFLLFWVPMLYYRTFYAPALALGIAFLISNYHLIVRNQPSGAAALAVAVLAFFNLAFYIGPYMRADSNELMAAARKANGLWKAGTMIYFSDHKEADTAFEYFNDSTVWRRLTPAARAGLDGEIQRVAGQGGTIWLNKGAAESVDPEWLAERTRGEQIEVRTPQGVARYVQLLPHE